MTSKKFWILAIALLMMHLYIYYSLYLKIDASKSNDVLNLVTGVIGNIVVVLLVGATTGAVFALIPFRKKDYLKKLKVAIPLLTCIVLLLMIAVFGNLVYQKKKYHMEYASDKYKNIKQQELLDCSGLRKGKFECGDLFFFRIGNKQMEFHKWSNEQNEFRIEWVDDCEYKLIFKADTSKSIHYRICSINENSYDCYVVNHETPKDPLIITVNRIK